jgi:hypothetical protein
MFIAYLVFELSWFVITYLWMMLCYDCELIAYPCLSNLLFISHHGAITLFGMLIMKWSS